MNKILPNRMDLGFQKYQSEFEQKALDVLRSGWYILGQEVTSFETEFAQYVSSPHCVGVANGLDALWMAFRVLGIGSGDEVIVQANTYIASVMGISMNGATPIFVEPDVHFQLDASKIEEKISAKTKAILVVHLYGHTAPMHDICAICDKYNLRLVEDCAQSHGSTYDGKMTGTFGDIGCFSFYPSKNLGAFGDAGAITTPHEEIAKQMKILRNYGSEKRYYNQIVGTNSRLDELQAGLLRVRLTHLEELNNERVSIANYYSQHIINNKLILPKTPVNTTSVWHQYTILCEERDALIQHLDACGVGSLIHYPIPPHLSEAYAYLGHSEGAFPITEEYAHTILSIPMYNGMTEHDLQFVVNALNSF